MFSREEEEAYTKTKQFIEGVNKTVQHQKDYLQHKVDEFLKNKDNSLEDRWEVWTKYSTTNTGTYIHRFPKEQFLYFDSWYYDGEERYMTIDYDDIAEASYSYALEQLKYSQEDADKFYDSMREYLMEQNLRSYKFDW